MHCCNSTADNDRRDYRFRIFAYGTLRPNGYYYRKICAGRIGSFQPALIRAQLFHLQAGYPAVCPGNDWIRGDILYFSDEKLKADIDRLEGFDPNRPAEENEYTLSPAMAFDLDRKLIGSFPVYWMSEQRIALEGGIYVPSGDWLLWEQGNILR